MGKKRRTSVKKIQGETEKENIQDETWQTKAKRNNNKIIKQNKKKV
jgi:hypothetical protein